MLIALGILLLALVAVVLKDWDFWFRRPARCRNTGSEARVRVCPWSRASPPATAAQERKPAKSPAPVPAAAEVPFSATTERAALPPLQVEVVAGNRHISVPRKAMPSIWM